MTDAELGAIESRLLNVGTVDESDVRALLGATKGLRGALRRRVNLWTERAQTLRLGGYVDRAEGYDRCVEDVRLAMAAHYVSEIVLRGPK